MKVYSLDADYKTLTADEAAELAPVVPLASTGFATGQVLRGRLAGKISKAEGPATARIAVAIGPRAWAASYVYRLEDRVTNDGLKEYRCTAAGTSASSGGPTGTESAITDGTVTWEYVRQVPVLLDTHDAPLVEGECTDALWLFGFEIYARSSRDTGTVVRQWHPTMVVTGCLTSSALPAPLSLPVEGPYPVIVESADDNVLHVIYQPEFDTGSITCMTYVLEVL